MKYLQFLYFLFAVTYSEPSHTPKMERSILDVGQSCEYTPYLYHHITFPVKK